MEFSIKTRAEILDSGKDAIKCVSRFYDTGGNNPPEKLLVMLQSAEVSLEALRAEDEVLLDLTVNYLTTGSALTKVGSSAFGLCALDQRLRLSFELLPTQQQFKNDTEFLRSLALDVEPMLGEMIRLLEGATRLRIWLRKVQLAANVFLCLVEKDERRLEVAGAQDWLFRTNYFPRLSAYLLVLSGIIGSND